MSKQDTANYVRGREENLFNMLGIDVESLLADARSPKVAARHGGLSPEAMQQRLEAELINRLENDGLDGKDFYSSYAKGLIKLPEVSYQLTEPGMISTDPFGGEQYSPGTSIKINQRGILEGLSLPQMVEAKYDVENTKQSLEQKRDEAKTEAIETTRKEQADVAFKERLERQQNEFQRESRRSAVLASAQRARERIAQQNLSALGRARQSTLSPARGSLGRGISGRQGFASVSNAVLG